MKNLLFGVLSRLSVENQARIFTNWLTSFFFVTDKTFPNRKMDVTNKNFAEKLPLIEASIDDAIFVAIDGEFTGLNCKETAISSLDTAAERYLKAQKSTTKFLLVQFGLCTFHYDPVKKVYSNRAFNFYVWPRPFSRAAPDPRYEVLEIKKNSNNVPQSIIKNCLEQYANFSFSPFIKRAMFRKLRYSYSKVFHFQTL
jgi:hypothetical protein